MRASEKPENHAWARTMVAKYVRRCKHLKLDIEAEALLGLVKAERHPDCPEGGDYQRFAYAFLRNGVCDLLKKDRRWWGMAPLGDSEAILGRPDAPYDDWMERRDALAGHLEGPKRLVFLDLYGELPATCLTQEESAARHGLSRDQVKRLNHSALETLRDLPNLHGLV